MRVGRARSRGKQHRDLRTEALIRGLRTRLNCRHGVFVRTEKVLLNFTVAQPDSNLLPLGHSRTIIPAPLPPLMMRGETVGLITDRCSYYYRYYI